MIRKQFKSKVINYYMRTETIYKKLQNLFSATLVKVANDNKK